MITITVSVIIPVYNEAANVQPLYRELVSVLDSMRLPFEIIFVNDGSRDNSLNQLIRLHLHDKRVKVIAFRRNYGQTAALDAGIKHAKHDLIITMDSDLQNDPHDIPRLLAKINEGYDFVQGWRFKRKDSVMKKITSRFAHFLRKKIINEKVHDSGCTLRIAKRKCFDGFTMYGEMHRYIPTLIQQRGFKITEIKVNHRQRHAGKTKYKWTRLFGGGFDMLLLWFWDRYSSRPLHFFGAVAAIQFIIAGVAFIEQVIKAIIVFASGNLFYPEPILVIAVMFGITGVLTFLFGFLAEIMVRTYYQDKPNYAIGKIYQ